MGDPVIGPTMSAINMFIKVGTKLYEIHSKYESQMKKLIKTLKDYAELIEEIEKSNNSKYLQFVKNLKSKVEEGRTLIDNCLEVTAPQLIKQHSLNKDLLELIDDLFRLLTLLQTYALHNLMERKEDAGAVTDFTWKPPDYPPFTVGLDEPLKELKMKLLPEGKSILVLTGPGGVGKTTLAKKFCHDNDVKETFRDHIFFVTVGKRPSMSLILQQLNQPMSSETPNNEDEAVADWPFAFLEQQGGNLLLIFDDVWSGSESLLEKFIPNWRSAMSNYKILVTSRSEFPHLGSSYHLNSLNDEDSMTLFRHSAFLGDRSSYVPLHLSSEIVKNCKGLPYAILVVGKSLCGKPIEIWQNTLLKWSKGSILDSENALLFRLQSSLDDLGKENYILLESFIDLASFPEDQAIPVPALIDMWAELYELREDIMCIANLYELTTRSLANVVVRRKLEEAYSEHFITQHDMLRSLAIHQTRHDRVLSKRLNIDIRGDDLPKWWTEQTKKPKKTRLLSISTDEVFSTKWPIMQLPIAEVLVLNFRTKNYVLPKFIRDMYKLLKVLIVINYGSVTAELGHFHLLSSLSNLKTIRLHRISIPSVKKNSIHLKSLQKISFFMCNISQVFGKDAIRISHALPVLLEINIDYCSELVEMQDDICNLFHLKKLSITNCHKLSALPEEIGKLLKLEVLRLRSCTDLVELPGSIGNLKKLNFLDISHCFSIKELPEEIGKLGSLRKLNMGGCSRLEELPESFSNLEELKEVICDEHTQGLWEPFLPTLRRTEIRVVEEGINLNWLHKW